MKREIINYPENPEDCNFPDSFLKYLDELDEARGKMARSIPVDPLYQSYDYEWDLDEEIPMLTILQYWNDVEKDLPSHDVILEEINDCIAETSYDDYISSFYSY
jgi:transcription elongation factor GreA-like protein